MGVNILGIEIDGNRISMKIPMRVDYIEGYVFTNENSKYDLREYNHRLCLFGVRGQHEKLKLWDEIEVIYSRVKGSGIPNTNLDIMQDSELYESVFADCGVKSIVLPENFKDGKFILKGTKIKHVHLEKLSLEFLRTISPQSLFGVTTEEAKEIVLHTSYDADCMLNLKSYGFKIVKSILASRNQ